MSTLFDFLETTYYTSVVLLFETLFIATVGFKKRGKLKILKYFPLYAILSSAQILICFACMYYDFKYALEVNTSTIYIFIIIELIIIYNFLLQIIKIRELRYSIYLIQGIFFAFTVYTLLTTGVSHSIQPKFNIVNSVCIALPCFFYFYETFSKPAIISLSKEPSFWVVIGFLFMAISTLPFYCLQNYIYKNIPSLFEQMYTISPIFYCLLFLLLLKAFICNPTTIK